MQLLINLATLVTAVAALVAILEMRSQRRSAYKPDLVVEASPFVVQQFHGYRVVTASRESGPDVESARYWDRIGVKCANVGAGAAKNVTCVWNCDFLKFVERIGRLDPAVAAKIAIDDHLVSIGVEPMSTHHLAPQMRGQAIAVRPETEQTVEFPLPFVYLVLLGLYFECARRATPEALRFENVAEAVELQLALTYRDLANSVHHKAFRVVPHLVVLTHAVAEGIQQPQVLADGYFEVSEA